MKVLLLLVVSCLAVGLEVVLAQDAAEVKDASSAPDAVLQTQPEDSDSAAGKKLTKRGYYGYGFGYGYGHGPWKRGYKIGFPYYGGYYGGYYPYISYLPVIYGGYGGFGGYGGYHGYSGWW